MVDDEMVLVPLVNHVASMDRLFTLNETAAFIWENLDAESTLDTLKKALLDNFEVESEEAEADLLLFLSELNKMNAEV